MMDAVGTYRVSSLGHPTMERIVCVVQSRMLWHLGILGSVLLLS